MSTPPCCVVYTTDETYLFPTLVSAIQARRFASRAGADVLICHFGVSKSAEAVFAGICAQEGIGLLAVDIEDLRVAVGHACSSTASCPTATRRSSISTAMCASCGRSIR
jgi:hypothetical protein